MLIDKEIKEKWLTSLRSGEFVQGTHNFKTIDGKYCCLGVLCMITNTPLKTDVGPYSDNFKAVKGILGVNIDNEKFTDLYYTNDNLCDGKYSAVIPLIEAIPTN